MPDSGSSRPVIPAEAAEVVQRVSPGPRLEMFARQERDGWDLWGTEAPGSLDLFGDAA